MNFNESREIVLRELAESLNNINEKEIAEFLALVRKSRRIFVAGEGRSGLMLKAFAQRLRHLGKESYVVGETTTPAAGKGDLLIAASGSGRTSGVINIVKLARKYGTAVVIVTASPSPALKKTAEATVTIPGKSPSRQLMGSVFEEALLLFCDSICLLLRDQWNVSETLMRKNHANLE